VSANVSSKDLDDQPFLGPEQMARMKNSMCVQDRLRLSKVFGLATTVPLADYAYVASVTAGLRRTEIRSEKRGVNGGQGDLEMVKSLVKLPRLDSNQQPFG
jgi:hypothetical protein